MFKANGVIGEEFARVKAKDMKSPPNHMQVFIDSMGMLHYSALGDMENKEFKDMMVETCGAMDFYGNKILKEDKEAHTNWYNSFKDLVKGILSFVLKNLAQCGKFRGKDDQKDAEDFFKSICDAAMKGDQAGSATPSAAPAQAPQV